MMTVPLEDLIRNAGVVGAGGAGFPTHVKVLAPVDTVLVNGASCEPLLMSDPLLMEYECDTILRGLSLVIDRVGAKRGVVCLKGKHRRAVARVQAATASSSDGRLSVFELADFYPAGDEHVLVNEVLGRTVPEAGLPLQVGVLVTNVETLFNVAKAADGIPVTHRFLTITGEVKNPCVICVPVGTPVAEVIALAGGVTIERYRIVDGGPMMGRVLSGPEQPITKTTSGILVLPEDHTVVRAKIMDPVKLRRLTQLVCCQCTMCTDLCPRYLLGHDLHPHKLMRGFGSKLVSGEVAREALLCSECGICEKYACPMLISPREINIQIKAQLRAQGVHRQSGGTPAPRLALRKDRLVPTSRLLTRLDLDRYHRLPAYDHREIIPERIILNLRQHIGAPSIPVVGPGDQVHCGDLVAEIADGALGARVHAGIDGVVIAVSSEAVIIERHPGDPL